MRIVLMCGKGGAGKSTLAAALAVRAAHAGQRTLLFSIDPAHSLGPVLGMPVGADVVPIAPNFFACELAAVENLSESWSDARGYAENLMRSQGIEQELGDELAMLPGVEEAAALIKLKSFIDSGLFDTIVLDNAPTGFALRLLTLPEIASWYGKHARRLYERFSGQLMMLLPMIGASFPMPSPEMIGGGFARAAGLRDLPALLTDPAVTSVKLALPPDALGLAEAKNLYTWLSVYGLTVDEVLVNPVLPAVVTDPFFANQMARETALVSEAREAFGALPMRVVDRDPEAPAGLDALNALGQRIWGETDPGARVGDDAAIRITTSPDEVVVSIKLPFVPREAVNLAKSDLELYITIGKHRRNLQLPPEAAELQRVKAKFADGKLLVTLARA